MNKNKITLLLFDFDGTLVDTTPLILRSFCTVWQQVFGFTFEDSCYIKTFGMLLPAAMRELIEQAIAEGRVARPDDPQVFLNSKVEELMLAYRAINLLWHDEMIRPFDGVDEVLRELKARGLKLGVVSSKMRAGLLRGLNHFQMAELFDVIIAGDDCENHKPHPEPLLRAIESAGAPHHETIYVGDSTYDIIAGRAAQVKTAAATWGPFPRIELENLRPDFLLDHPKDLLAIYWTAY
jgi:pyrophosphatase PpaX